MEARDIAALAELLADVFADNPAYRQIYRPKDTLPGLRWLFERNLLLNQRYGVVKVICLPADGQVIGTFSLTPPDADAPSVIDYLKFGVLTMPFKFGLPALIRMFSLLNQNEDAISTAVKGARKPGFFTLMKEIVEEKSVRPLGGATLSRLAPTKSARQGEDITPRSVKSSGYWYLGLVAVARMHRNRGIASHALAQAFAELGTPSKVVLTTQLESNVRLYSRLGFQILAEKQIGYRQDLAPNWVMCRNN